MMDDEIIDPADDELEEGEEAFLADDSLLMADEDMDAVEAGDLIDDEEEKLKDEFGEEDEFGL